jgi:hypothetical protein
MFLVAGLAYTGMAAFPDDEEPAKKPDSKQATKTSKAPSKSPVKTSAGDDTAKQDDMDQAKLIAGLQKKNIAVSTASPPTSTIGPSDQADRHIACRRDGQVEEAAGCDIEAI